MNIDFVLFLINDDTFLLKFAKLYNFAHILTKNAE